ncbi:dipeptidase [Aliiglaciecola lipolytica]|uniref:Renal dipeptidase family protein n=1 Tax=Aliiglaciecola lipolytica E3 TaxID=1127673 RepID=K6YQU1_9ALTE|nr:dipeptidase [Aliiglaciecola lipolytica]GAC13690.1 renal dipeptidase family protein [Aliiglaciecola lipolytica E3]
MKKSNIAVVVMATIFLGYVGVRTIVPGMLEKKMNQVVNAEPVTIDEETIRFHNSLIVGDWHADTLLWNRDISDQSDVGHVDIPRLQQGNVALQMFTTVTKSPAGLNYEKNATDAADNITRLSLAQGWPIATWTSLTARAIHQAEKLLQQANDHPNELMLVTSQATLSSFLKKRESNPTLVAGLLGTEGSHALDGELENIQVLYDKGFRMMSLQHFFDNKLGGSLHGTSQSGLTSFGSKAVEKMQALGIIVDISHSSEQTVRDVLAMSKAPLVVSHTGLKGHCDSKRNISDSLMQQIAAAEGLIAVGYWDGAICSTRPSDIADAIIYGINLVGENHIALGSDFDGAVATEFDTSQLAIITQILLQKNVSKQTVAKVMGGNMLTFLQNNLPAQ